MLNIVIPRRAYWSASLLSLAILAASCEKKKLDGVDTKNGPPVEEPTELPDAKVPDCAPGNDLGNDPVNVTDPVPELAANGVMMQYFHWYLPNDGKLWDQVNRDSKMLAERGITALWLPPAFKGNGGGYDVGYGTYDLYDLGEFDQKGSIRTKYGSKDQYLRAINEAKNAGINIYADIVLNHRMGADGTESAPVKRVDPGNRNVAISDTFDIDAYTLFEFPGRNGKYSDFSWHWYHFDGVDWADNIRQPGHVYKFDTAGKSWDSGVSLENGNYDYLMGADVDFDHPEVMAELKAWGEWYVTLANLDGFRLDAIKHIKTGFFNEWLTHLRQETGRELFTVGEYWDYDIGTLLAYLDNHNDEVNKMSLFDAPLHKNFHDASKASGFYDMGAILNNTLMQVYPTRAVTLVENHDTQPLQALESPVEDWFKPLAYAIILLRSEGYPNLFYADYYGATYKDYGRDGKQYEINLKSHREVLDVLLAARRDYAYGRQHAYFDHQDVIGFTREGDADRPEGLAVLLSDGPGGEKRMFVGRQHAGKCFQDLLGEFDECVTITEDGHGMFKTQGGKVSVWVGN